MNDTPTTRTGAAQAAGAAAPADYIAAYMPHRPVDAAKAAFVIVDMQYATGSREGALARKLAAEGSTLGDYRFERIETRVLPNMIALRERFTALGRPVVHVTIGAARADALDAPLHMRTLFVEFANHVGSREHEILDELKPRDGEFVVRKTTIGAFASTGIDSLLRALGCEQLYVAGISTNMCVETTAREAADRGYQVTLVEDACATTHEELHRNTMRNFQRLFGRVRSTRASLDELAGADVAPGTREAA
ncbi:MAG: cysteine hydrolase family protein [Lautropia sp.]